MKNINWSSKFLIPKILKNMIPDNLYKNKFLKNYIIISMMRNYVAPNKENKENLINLNKQLITSTINTNNLTIFTKKSTKVSDSLIETYDLNFFKIIIHINNIFNPTNIKLFDKDNKIHLYQQQGDSTLHINMGILTFFKILIIDPNKIKIRNSKNIEDYRKSKVNENYFLPNSNISWYITELIKSKTVTLYEKDLENKWVIDCEYFLEENNEFDPFKFSYDSELDYYWRFDLRDILIFYHNIWWDSILILFNLYNLNVWGGRNTEINTNKFRLKVYLLQLLGGFDMVNRMEKVERSLKDHYVLSDKIFNEIKTLGKKLIKADVKDKNLTNNNIIISEMFGNLGSKIDVTNEITSNLEKIILGDKNQIIEDPFEDFNLEVLSSNSPKNIKNITFSQEDEINLFESNQAFILNYHFNILLVFLLGLEMLINLVYSILIKNLDNNSLKRILFLCIDNYTNLVWYYNEKFKNLEALNIPKDFPKSFDLADSNICYCDIKKGNNYFILLFSELKMNYKYIESIETKEFCENKCLNNNTSKS